MDEKLWLINTMKVIEYKAGEYIFHQGDEGDKFYIIMKGNIYCGFELPEGKFDVVRALFRGDYFGEIALINDVKRTLSVRSVTKCQLLSLTRECFERIYNCIKKDLKGDYSSKATKKVTKNLDRKKSFRA